MSLSTQSNSSSSKKRKNSKSAKTKKVTKVLRTDSDPKRSKLDIVKRYKLSRDQLHWMLKNIYISRKVDDTEILMRKQNNAFFQISGAGHEGILTAVSMILKPSHDFFLCYYRDRALCLGLGMTPYEMLCQANGNLGDVSGKGRQMPAHWGHKKLGIINKSSCTGTQFLQAVGVSEAGKYLKDIGNEDGPEFNNREITYVSSGDGTTSQGEFWEGLTTAVVNHLPVMFCIEDNGYAISVPVEVQTPKGSISKALEDFPGLKIFRVDGSCPIESYAVVKEAEKYLRLGKGPVLLHAKVTRPYSHSLSDDHSMYRTKKDLDEEKLKDVVNTFPAFLKSTKLLTEEEDKAIHGEIDREVKMALEDCLKTDWPAKETWGDHLYSDEIDPMSSEFETQPNFEGKADIPMATAINMVLKSEVKANPLVRMFGEDVADFSQLEKLEDETLKGKGGVFKVTSGVQRVGIKGQVFNSPLAEANIIGRAIGQALRGIKPVVEIQFFDYIWTAYMQLKNEMSTLRYRSAGDYKCPMVIRVPTGGYLRGGSIYHSQSGESFFTHIPGIRVIMPSNALDAIGLLRTAIRCDDPVLFLEHKHLYYQGYNRTAYPGDDFTIPFGKANVVQEGVDATVVCWGALVQRSVEAAKKLASEGFSIEIIDARSIAPFDLETTLNSLRKTNRLLIAHEEIKTSGFAGEICALVNENGFELLDAPIMRVCAKDCHCAYNPDLEEEILPHTDDVYNKLKELLNY